MITLLEWSYWSYWSDRVISIVLVNWTIYYFVSVINSTSLIRAVPSSGVGIYRQLSRIVGAAGLCIMQQLYKCKLAS